MTLRRELIWQPILGGGIRGLDWTTVGALPVDVAEDLYAWIGERRKRDLQALRAMLGGGR